MANKKPAVAKEMQKHLRRELPEALNQTESLNRLIVDAKTAMRDAKIAGRNQVRVCAATQARLRNNVVKFPSS